MGSAEVPRRAVTTNACLLCSSAALRMLQQWPLWGKENWEYDLVLSEQRLVALSLVECNASHADCSYTAKEGLLHQFQSAPSHMSHSGEERPDTNNVPGSVTLQ